MRKSPRQSPKPSILQPEGTSRSSSRPAAFLWEAWLTTSSWLYEYWNREKQKMWKDLRKSDLHIAICKLHSKRKWPETPCQRRIQQLLGNKCSLGWSPGLRRQQTPCRSPFACWLFEPESNMSLLSVLGRIALWLLLWWPSRALVDARALACGCTKAPFWVCAHAPLPADSTWNASLLHFVVEVVEDRTENSERCRSLPPASSAASCSAQLRSALSSHRHAQRRLGGWRGRERKRSGEKLTAFCLSILSAETLPHSATDFPPYLCSFSIFKFGCSISLTFVMSLLCLF